MDTGALETQLDKLTHTLHWFNPLPLKPVFPQVNKNSTHTHTHRFRQLTLGCQCSRNTHDFIKENQTHSEKWTHIKVTLNVTETQFTNKISIISQLFLLDSNEINGLLRKRPTGVSSGGISASQIVFSLPKYQSLHSITKYDNRNSNISHQIVLRYRSIDCAYAEWRATET